MPPHDRIAGKRAYAIVLTSCALTARRADSFLKLGAFPIYACQSDSEQEAKRSAASRRYFVPALGAFLILNSARYSTYSRY